ncbi:MgtC/SapB family protein [Chitinibacter bivalviorum]|uniref:Protein MgtC n=1 Tax=Chitinibacter bivalviorum TaxID=2739434 RepID=A0A7H9BI20_9NEIS|nr:MgtC/SapB family protein [Chitinibacter bivalviorum]QLG88189.1 MgtC/SapB family protein [Chitinibacter bivalviorum]
MVDFVTKNVLDFWSYAEMRANAQIIFTLLVALVLGLLLGYERSYHGRAAGMRTYALVCMASAAAVIVAGFPNHWYGGQLVNQQISPSVLSGDPTRVIQGVLTGVGFLCAGVIMKEGMNISGLTTAASIWVASVIGVLVGVGFYLAAIILSMLSAGLMMWGARLEGYLPSRPAIGVRLRFRVGHPSSEHVLRGFVHTHGYDLAGGTVTIDLQQGRQEWHFVCVAHDKRAGSPLGQLAQVLSQLDGLEDYQLTHARN